MAQVIVTAGAARGLQKCRRFLVDKNPNAVRRAGEAISRQFRLLEHNPEIGRPLPEYPELRELIIGFGATGYVALNSYDADIDVVYILAFRHQKEAGY